MIYSEIIQSKNGLDIPVFTDNRSMHSKYDPLREAQTFGNDIKQDSKFSIIIGLGGAYHIESFVNKNPDHFILVIENSSEDIEYLSKIECVKKVLSYKNVKIISKDEILTEILKYYLPQFYGGINILFNRAWHDSNPDVSKEITDCINDALTQCSRDYSVQCHFGLIWQKNILKNLKSLSKMRGKKFLIDCRKTAAVIAAGPSLDKTIDILKEKRDSYFIIATDTACSVINSRGMNCDAVVSIDGQNISHKHFIGRKDSSTVFVFDLQANSSAVNYISKFSENIIFTKSGHPFCNYAQINGLKNSSFMNLESGAGTVTIAAVDFASKCGFKNIEVFGADFSYIFNKPYTKGTYLDCLYRQNENRKNPAEKRFVDLIYRTQIKKEKVDFNGLKFNEKTTQIKTDILDSYKETFIEWIKSRNFNCKYENFIYYINSDVTDGKITFSTPEPFTFETPRFDYEKFKKVIGVNSAQINEKITQNGNEDNLDKNMPYGPENFDSLTVSLLPLTAYYRAKDKKLTFVEGLKLALSKILEYT